MEKKDGHEYLKSSYLFNSLLFGEEIRYTAFINFIFNELRINPLDYGSFENPIRSYREKSHTDVWINKIIN
jgi:hypothetical protein